MISQNCYIVFITGGVLSSLGKGVVAGSIGVLLQNQNLKVSIMKVDPYLNVDAGTMSPFEHGEVFVSNDGAESDLDLGTYERFLNRSLGKKNHLTAGQVFKDVIEKERRGDYLGSTVQIIPHITHEIKNRILDHDSDLDVLLVEIGGTVGDIESLPFLEAVRQLSFEWKNTLSIHVTLMPFVGASGELKTKPTQHSVRELRSIGLIPDLIVCRTAVPMGEQHRSKIALFSNLPLEAIFESPDVSSIYDIPLLLKEQGLLHYLLKKMGKNMMLTAPSAWDKMLENMHAADNIVPVVIVGKYIDLSDAYKSLREALIHGAIDNKRKVEISYIDAESLEKGDVHALETLKNAQGILVPGGFGIRGIEGKMIAARYARQNNIPYFGICLGMQIALIDFARDILNLSAATSQEFDPQSPDLIFEMIECWTDQEGHVQKSRQLSGKGGTLRVGSYACYLTESSLSQKIYKTLSIQERHRHRFEFNNHYKKAMEDKGVVFSGIGENDLVDIIELKNHRWFIGTQFHPEFLSRPTAPHPLFAAFIKAIIEYQNDNAQ